MTRFPPLDVSSRTHGPAVTAAGDGLDGVYSALIHSSPSGGTCKVVIPAFSRIHSYTALCSASLTGSPGDRVLIAFDEEKQPWVICGP